MNIFGKWSKWEYWPAFMFYIPILPYYLYLAIKAKHPVFFVAANPGIEAGGSGFESKYKTIQLIPKSWRPETIFVPKGTNITCIKKLVEKSNIQYPLIAKPDVGFRGLLVSKIRNFEELEIYFYKIDFDIILQEFINGENEYGVFYHRKPGENQGVISSLTKKVYLHVIGDGKSNILKLMQSDENNIYFIDLVRAYHGDSFLNEIPKNKHKIILSDIGNHSKGATFLNINDKISKDLEARIDIINKKIERWYYGRLDIKVPSLSSLIKGDDIKIIEINGLISEPTHIYDTGKNTYISAMKEIVRHWFIIYDVAMASRKIGAKYYSFPKMLIQVYRLIKVKLKLESLSKI